MIGENSEIGDERQSTRSIWGVLGLAALVGAAAAVVILAGRNREQSSRWSVDDLIDAADRVAGDLESRLMHDRASA